MGNERKLRSVEQYGQRYVQEYLASAKDRHNAIITDPLAALAFMHGKMFMRGRRDTVSVVFRDRTGKVLERYKTMQEIDLSELERELVAQRVNNRHDRRMIAESISFACRELQDYDCNVYTWAVDAVRSGRSGAAFAKLVSIHAIGDKLATFYLRDVALLEDIEASIHADAYAYFQPVDTWVERVALSLGLISPEDTGKRDVIKRKIISECLAADVSPLLFNAGAWMVGAHAYRLLVERL